MRSVPLSLLVLACHPAAETGAEKPAEQNAAVSVVKVDQGPLEKTVTTFGSVEFAAEQERTLPFVKPGQVSAVLVVTGQVVKKGDALLNVGAVPRGAPEVQQALIDVDYAARELSRVQRLVTENLATNQELQTAAKNLSAAQATLRGLGGGDAVAGSMHATSDGVVAEVLVRRGDVVQAGQPGVVLAGRNSLTVRAGFEVEDLPALHEGLLVRISPVFAGGEQAHTEGTLSTLHRVVNPTTQLVEGLVQLEAPPVWMATGLLVKTTAIIEARDATLRVPNAALTTRDGKQGVFLVENGHARFRPLDLGIFDDERREVKSGLAVGDTVVTVGRSSLTDGMAVRVDAPPP